jgi:hypothetical protein
MRVNELPQLNRVLTHQVGNDGGKAFLRKLATLHGWEDEFALGAYQEYLRFCYLVVTHADQQQLSPSYIVDQVWHLHLTYSQDYWKVFCPSILQFELHHQPANGSQQDAFAMREQYAQTIKRYRTEFGEIPHEYWPSMLKQLQGVRHTRLVDQSRFWVIPKLW